MVISLAQLDKKSFPKFRTTDYMPVADGCVIMISAIGGTGKTYACIRSMVKYVAENKTKQACAWFSEDPQGLLASRIDSVVKDEGLANDDIQSRMFFKTDPPFPFAYPERGRMTIADEAFELMEEFAPFDYIIFDPLLAFYGGSENDNSQARAFMQIFINWALAENKTIIFIHHSTKGNSDNPSKSRGAGAFADACRICYELKSITGSKDRRLVITKDNWGANYYGFTDFEKIIKVIPEDTSRPKDTYEHDQYDEREFILAWSEDRTYNYGTSSYTWEAIRQILTQDICYCAHGFEGGHRKADNVNTGSDVVILDVDDGYTLQDALRLFAPYKAYIATTKSHQKEKNGKTADRFRVIIAIKETIKLDAKDYSLMMSQLHCKFPFADAACKDISRAFTAYSVSEVYELHGKEMIDAELFLKRGKAKEKRKQQRFEKYQHLFKEQDAEGIINSARKVIASEWTEGNRNFTLARIALWFRDSGKMSNQQASDAIRMLNAESSSPLPEQEVEACVKHKFHA